MKHIRVERCQDCTYFEKRIPRDGNGGWSGFCVILAKYLPFPIDPIHPDCPLEDDHTFAFIAALDKLYNAQIAPPVNIVSRWWISATEHAKAVLEKAKSARPQSSGGGR